MPDARLPVLIVEDSDEDYEIIVTCLLRAGVRNTLIHFRDGMELFEYLKQYSSKRNTIPPAVIMLDVNLPGLSGHSILAEIRKNDAIGLIPVVVLSTSNSPRDINLAYRNGANSYLVKPVSLTAFERLIAAFSSYWLETAEMPLLPAKI